MSLADKILGNPVPPANEIANNAIDRMAAVLKAIQDQMGPQGEALIAEATEAATGLMNAAKMDIGEAAAQLHNRIDTHDIVIGFSNGKLRIGVETKTP